MIGDESFSIPMMLIIAVLCGNLQHYRSEVVLADNEGKCNLEFTTFARFTSVPVSCDFFLRFQIGFMVQLRFFDDRRVLRMMQPNDAWL